MPRFVGRVGIGRRAAALGGLEEGRWRGSRPCGNVLRENERWRIGGCGGFSTREQLKADTFPRKRETKVSAMHSDCQGFDLHTFFYPAVYFPRIFRVFSILMILSTRYGLTWELPAR